MIIGIIAGAIVVAVCVFAFSLCKAASNWEKEDYFNDR